MHSLPPSVPRSICLRLCAFEPAALIAAMFPADWRCHDDESVGGKSDAAAAAAAASSGSESVPENNNK